MSRKRDPRHPRSSYDARYPYNNGAVVTESGHEFHMDDTPGAERIRLAHRSGSYVEMSADGRRVDMTTGHQLTYVKGGITSTTDGNRDEKVAGSSRLNVSGDSHTEVKGSVSQAVDGGMATIVGGDVSTAVTGDASMAVRGNMSFKMSGGGKIKVDGSKTIKVDGPLTIESGDSITLRVGGSSITLTDGLIVIRASMIEENP